MRVGVTVFPGTNNEWDNLYVLKNILNFDAEFVKPDQTDLTTFDAIVIAGGFSYGDYLRVGAIASQQPIIGAIKKAAKEGMPIIGICNGFQIPTETGLLPGVLRQNLSTRFISKPIYLRVENSDTLFTHKYQTNEIAKMYIAHYDGNYTIDAQGLKHLEENNQIVFKYCDKQGSVNSDTNPNGSTANIAGIVNSEKNVLGMMPHPERSSEAILGTVDGLKVWNSLASFLKGDSNV